MSAIILSRGLVGQNWVKFGPRTMNTPLQKNKNKCGDSFHSFYNIKFSFNSIKMIYYVRQYVFTLLYVLCTLDFPAGQDSKGQSIIEQVVAIGGHSTTTWI